jgi:predicted exporter
VEPASRLAGLARATAARPPGDALGKDRQQLIDQPDAFIQQRVQALFDPFTGFSLVPSQDDWLGLTGRIQNSQPQHGSVQLDIGSGALIADADGKSWVLLRARTTGNAFDMNLPLQVADLLHQPRSQQRRVQLLAASGLLYAASGQQQATREITWVGGGATVGILLLLLLAFRRWRVLLAFVPVLVGMLFGAVACVALFGHMHVMTLVLGSSLIGVAVDYPLHYLSKLEPEALAQLAGPAPDPAGAEPEPGHQRHRLPGPGLDAVPGADADRGVLRRRAARRLSVRRVPAAGPARGVELRPAQWPLRIARPGNCVRACSSACRARCCWCGAAVLRRGLWQLNSANDIRQWVGAPPLPRSPGRGAHHRLPAHQPVLPGARGQPAAIARTPGRAERAPGATGEPGQAQGYLALSHWSPARRTATAARGAEQPAATLAAAAGPGRAASALHAEVAQLQALPTEDIDAALAGPWPSLGAPVAGPGRRRRGGMVSLQGLNNPALLRVQAVDLPGVQLVDRLGELNRVFAATQISAAELKLMSCGLIVLLLILPFGFGGALRIVALPLLAALCSLASLGWLGQPLTLFSLFGLLLVTAISVDYAILMREQIGAAVSLLGTLLAALTTWLSFGLLAVSSTPAVSNFGLSVSLGLA